MNAIIRMPPTGPIGRFAAERMCLVLILANKPTLYIAIRMVTCDASAAITGLKKMKT